MLVSATLKPKQLEAKWLLEPVGAAVWLCHKQEALVQEYTEK